MKDQITHITKSMLIGATVFAVAIAASAGNHNPGIFPINSAPHGKPYGS